MVIQRDIFIVRKMSFNSYKISCLFRKVLVAIFCVMVILIYGEKSYGSVEIKIPIIHKEEKILSDKFKIFRLHFFLPQDLKKKTTSLGVGLWFPANAEEVFLNGHKIGQRGSLSNAFVIAPPCFRVYKLSSELVKPEGENILEIKLIQIFFKLPSLTKSIEIGSYEKLQEKHFKDLIYRIIIEIFIFSFLLVILGILFISYISQRERSYFYAAISIFVYIFSLALESCFFYFCDLKTPAIQRLSISIYTLVPLTFFYFFKTFLHEYFKFEKYITVFALLFAISIYLFLSLKNIDFFIILWLVFLITYFLIFVSILRKSYKRQTTAQLKSMTVLLLSFVLSYGIGDVIAIFKLMSESLFFSIYPQDYMMLFWAMAILFIVLKHFFNLSRERHQLAARILTIQEEERRRLAADLHDSLGQNLLSIKFKLQNFQDKKSTDGLENIVQTLDESIELVREISSNLRPVILDRFGIEMAFQIYINRFMKDTGIKVFLTINLDKKPSSLIEVNFFRILQECLTNVFKHAHAKNVFVYLYSTKGNFVLRVLDDGVGFNYENEIKSPKGQGLFTMRERINFLNGRFFIKSLPEKGTEVFVEVPSDENYDRR